MAALNFDPTAYLDQQWRNRDSLSPDALYALWYWQLPGCREYGELLYRRLHGEYNWTSEGVDWNLKDDCIRAVLYNEFSGAMKTLDTGVSAHEWFDDIIHSAHERLFDRRYSPVPSASNSSCPPGEEPEAITAFKIAGWLVKTIRNLANDELSARAKTPRIYKRQQNEKRRFYRPVSFDEAWMLYTLAAGGSVTVEKWWSKRFRNGQPHPWLEFTKDHFYETGSSREPERLTSSALNASKYRAKQYRFKPGEAALPIWGGDEQYVQREIDRRLSGAAPDLDNDARLVSLFPTVADGVCQLLDLQAGLLALASDERAAIAAYYFDGLIDKDAAKRSRVKVATFSKRRQRALESLVRDYSKRRFPPYENLLVTAHLDYQGLNQYLAELSVFEFRQLLRSHEGHSPAEFTDAQYDKYVDAHSLLSSRDCDPVFTDPDDPWDIARAPLYVRPTVVDARSQPKPPRPPLTGPKTTFSPATGAAIITYSSAELVEVTLANGNKLRRRPDQLVEMDHYLDPNLYNRVSTLETSIRFKAWAKVIARMHVNADRALAASSGNRQAIYIDAGEVIKKPKIAISAYRLKAAEEAMFTAVSGFKPAPRTAAAKEGAIAKRRELNQIS